jgi:hypothetical protein
METTWKDYLYWMSLGIMLLATLLNIQGAFMSFKIRKQMASVMAEYLKKIDKIRN